MKNEKRKMYNEDDGEGEDEHEDKGEDEDEICLQFSREL